MKERCHPVRVDGYDGSLEDLARTVCRMRYDAVADFFGYCAKELLRQANADMGRSRKKLATLLTSAWGIAVVLHRVMHRAFELCAPHMKEELAEHPPTLKKVLS